MSEARQRLEEQKVRVIEAALVMLPELEYEERRSLEMGLIGDAGAFRKAIEATKVLLKHWGVEP